MLSSLNACSRVWLRGPAWVSSEVHHCVNVRVALSIHVVSFKSLACTIAKSDVCSNRLSNRATLCVCPIPLHLSLLTGTMDTSLHMQELKWLSWLNRITAIRPGDFWQFHVRATKNSQNWQCCKTHWHSGAPSGVADPGPVFKPRAPI